MANELMVNGGAAAQPALMPQIMESVLMAGDLAKLTAQQRVSFYGSVCESLRLNPLTRPFEYINLNGKLTLYTTKNCTDQLRARDNISIKIVSRELIEGIYIVTAGAVTPSGRTDESTGAVAIDSLKGEARANAYMKAETKAKRRATLSICGLSFPDESELESIPGARRVAVDMTTGEIEAPIDTGGYPMNTQAAADHVAKQKLAEMQQKQGPAPAKSKDFPMLKAFKEIKSKIGTDAYYKILGENGYTKSDEITDVSKGRSIYAEMQRCLKTQQEHQQEPEHQPQPAAEMAEQAKGELWPEEGELWPEGRD